MDEIMSICKEQNILFIEDSAQALGASYKGKMVGTFGTCGTYSFDFFKITTCGEGGVLVTNDKEIYRKADVVSDHGHDHIGNNRGMENHPFLGMNYRIGEINAAIGLAQMRKIEFMLRKQKEHFIQLKNTLKAHSQISLRLVPDEEGDSCTFISFLLPNEKDARMVMKNFTENGVDGVQYWYDNHFHYYKNWEHIHNLKSTSKLPVHILNTPQNYAELKFPQSDAIISRLISMVVKVNWTPEQLKERIKKMHATFHNVFGTAAKEQVS
jgi:8-amino-3,8-dideoxy-alpha-D-manno-octulosonate transaminase